MAFALDHIWVAGSKDLDFQAINHMGLIGGKPGIHQGQGTGNQCFIFDNAFLELLWIENEAEVKSPPVDKLGLWQRLRWRETGSNPVGICLRASSADELWPCNTWDYFPPHRDGKVKLPIAANSGDLSEPLIFFNPPRPRPKDLPLERRPRLQDAIGLSEITSLRLDLPREGSYSKELQTLVALGLIEVRNAQEHHLEIVIDRGHSAKTCGFLPQLPLSISW